MITYEVEGNRFARGIRAGDLTGCEDKGSRLGQMEEIS